MIVKIGYTRVSIIDDTLELQLAALKRAGCDRIYQEKNIEETRDRPELQQLLNLLRPNDVVIVWGLDQLAQSRRQLFELVKLFQEKKISLQSLTEAWADTMSDKGKMIMTVLAGIIDFEHKLLHERTAVRRVVSKHHSIPFGRHKKMTDEQKFSALRLWKEGMPVIEIAKIFNVHRTTIYRLEALLNEFDSTKEHK